MTDTDRQLDALRAEVNVWRTMANFQADAIQSVNSALGIPPNTLVAKGEDALSRIARLVALMRESRREHLICQKDPFHPDGDYDADSDPGDVCVCGADAWNAKVDAALVGIL